MILVKFSLKMTSQNIRSALAFAVFSFLLVLIATFGVVYRYDLYPGYGTLVQIGLYNRPNVSATSSIDHIEKLTKNGRVPELEKTSDSKLERSEENPRKDFFAKVVAVFSVTSPSTAVDERQEGTLVGNRMDHPKSPEEIYKPSLPEMPPEKMSKGKPPKPETPRPEYEGFIDRLIKMVNKDLEDFEKGSQNINNKLDLAKKHDVLPSSHERQSQIQNSIASSKTSTTSESLCSMFSESNIPCYNVDEEISLEPLDVPEFPFADLLDDVVVYFDDVSSESESEEIPFGRNPKHFPRLERLPEFPRPTIDFPFHRDVQG